MRSAELRVESAMIARARIATGRPVWDRTVDIRSLVLADQTNTDPEHVAGVARQVAARLVAKLPPETFEITHPDYDFDFAEAVEEMAEMTATSYTQDPDYGIVQAFANLLDTVYDWADTHRVWLGR